MASQFTKWMTGQPSLLPRILILDGGVSSHLEDLIPDQSFAYRSLWSSSLLISKDDHKYIRQGHEDWEAADVLTTVTYQCHYQSSLWPDFMNDGLMDQLWDTGIELAHQVASTRNQAVVASSGCYGAALANGAEYTGAYGDDRTLDDLIQFHRAKLDRIHRISKHVDGVALETVPSLLECQALAELVPSYSLPCWVSLACRNGNELNDGTSVREALSALRDVKAIGFNCCDADHLPELVDHLVNEGNNQRSVVVLYPNSGETWNASNETWERGTSKSNDLPDQLMKCIQKLPQNMRILVGGCCRTTPKDIKRLKGQVAEYLRLEKETAIDKSN